MNDRAEITDLIARVAHVSDHGDVDDYFHLYTKDASWEYASMTFRSINAIVENARKGREIGGVGPGSDIRHIVTTMSVDYPARGRGGRQLRSRRQPHHIASHPSLHGALPGYPSASPDGWRITRREVTPA